MVYPGFFKSVLQALRRYHVSYAVAGGYALAFHGAPRGTIDVDLAIVLSLKNIKAAARALESIGLRSKIPVTAEDIYKFREEYIRNKNLKVWTFINLSDPTEIVDLMIIYDLVDLQTVRVKFEKGLMITVISKEELIRMKLAAGRPQDLVDIKSLREVEE